MDEKFHVTLACGADVLGHVLSFLQKTSGVEVGDVSIVMKEPPISVPRRKKKQKWEKGEKQKVLREKLLSHDEVRTREIKPDGYSMAFVYNQLEALSREGLMEKVAPGHYRKLGKAA